MTAILSQSLLLASAECEHLNKSQGDFAYPTCTEQGYYDVVCNDCGYTERVYTEAYGHSWGKWVTIQEQTCTQQGIYQQTCDECYQTYTTYADATGHQFDYPEVTVEATCQNAGEQQFYCYTCGKTITESIPKKDHSFGSYKTTKEATCASEGTKTSTCSVCGKEQTESIPKTDHKLGDWEIKVEATDHSMGTKAQTCSVCANEVTEDFYPDGTILPGAKKDLDVLVFQELLKEEGYLNDTVDGIYGNNTEKAVSAFQEEKGFEVTGIGYPQTISALVETLLDREAETTLDNGIYVSRKDGEEITFTFSMDGATWEWSLKNSGTVQAAPVTEEAEETAAEAEAAETEPAKAEYKLSDNVKMPTIGKGTEAEKPAPAEVEQTPETEEIVEETEAPVVAPAKEKTSSKDRLQQMFEENKKK